jgi:hypothetical protein
MRQKEDRKADKLLNNFLELEESKRPARLEGNINMFFFRDSVNLSRQ